MENVVFFDTKHSGNLNQVCSIACLEKILGKEQTLVCQVETIVLGSPWVQKVLKEKRDKGSVPSWAERTSSSCMQCPDDHKMCIGILSHSPDRDLTIEVNHVAGNCLWLTE